MSKKFGVTFVKNDHKKRKVCTDGWISITPRGDAYLAILSNDINEEVIRRTIGEKEAAKYAVGSDVALGVYSITIENALSTSQSASPCNVVRTR